MEKLNAHDIRAIFVMLSKTMAEKSGIPDTD